MLSENDRGWKKEVNFISWNERDPKIEIREWSPDHAKMSKGITFTDDEIAKLRDILNAIDLNNLKKGV